MHRTVCSAVSTIILLFPLCFVTSCNKGTAPVRRTCLGGPTLTIVSGNNQEVTIGGTLRNRLVVSYKDEECQAYPRQNIRFYAVSGSGQVLAKPFSGESPFEVLTVTDPNGFASATYQGSGPAAVRVEAMDHPELTVLFTILAYSGPSASVQRPE